MSRRPIHAPILIATVLAAALLPGSGSAAESYDSCTGIIASLPAVIATQGTFCMDEDLATAATSGDAILVTTNNVIIDCNGFKLGGLAAGIGTATVGIRASGRRNVTIRDCNLRGFHTAISLPVSLQVGGGHLVEDNRIEGSTGRGIFVGGDSLVVRRNLITDTGGTASGTADGIVAIGVSTIENNTIRGIEGTSDLMAGISVGGGHGIVIRDNTVSDLVASGEFGAVFGILVQGAKASVHDNDLFAPSATDTIGIHCSIADAGARDNTLVGFGTAVGGCATQSNNQVY